MAKPNKKIPKSKTCAGKQQQGSGFTKPIIVCEHAIVPDNINKMADNIKMAWSEMGIG